MQRRKKAPTMFAVTEPERAILESLPADIEMLGHRSKFGEEPWGAPTDTA